MPRALRSFLAVPVLVLAAVGVAACGSSSSSTTATTSSTATTTAAAPAPVVGKTTSVVINPQTAELLKKNEITLTAVAPATVKTTVVLPVVGGQLAVATFTGTVQDTGGVTLSHHGKSVTLTSAVLDTSTKRVTALVDGQRLAVFELNLSSLVRTTGVKGTAVASGVKLIVTPEVATALNSALEVSAFKAGQLFGIATLTIAVKS